MKVVASLPNKGSRVAEDADRESAFTWKIENVAKCLDVGVGTVKRWLNQGYITEADGWIKAGKLNRFIRTVVLARISAGQFAKGLDRDGHPVSRNGKHQIRGDEGSGAA